MKEEEDQDRKSVKGEKEHKKKEKKRNHMSETRGMKMRRNEMHEAQNEQKITNVMKMTE